MSIDLENRLRGYAQVLDAAIESDLSLEIELLATVDEELVELDGRSSSPRRAALVAVAAAGLLIGGCLALLTDHHSETLIPAAETSTYASTAPTAATFPPTTEVPVDDPTTWDPIRVAAGTLGWYEFGEVSAALASSLTDLQSWTTDYTARFYLCSSYTVDADGPICTGLRGGNFVAPSTFAGTGELGTHLGDISTADLAWILARDSSLGYGEVTGAPPATPVAVGDHAGLMYSKSGTSYLVWEQAPGVHLWIRATGWTTDDMVGLALTVRPATLPDRLPLALIVDSVSPSGAPSFDDLLIGSHHGMPLCAEVDALDGCVSLPPVSDVAMVVGTDPSGALSAVAAVSPVGSVDRLRVELDGGERVTVAPAVSPLGFQYSIFRPGTARITAAHMVAPDDSIVATATLSTVVPASSSAATTTSIPAATTTSTPNVATPRLVDGANPDRFTPLPEGLARLGFTLHALHTDPTTGVTTAQDIRDEAGGRTGALTVTPGTPLVPENHNRTPIRILEQTDVRLHAEVDGNDGWRFEITFTRTSTGSALPTIAEVQDLLYSIDP